LTWISWLEGGRIVSSEPGEARYDILGSSPPERHRPTIERCIISAVVRPAEDQITFADTQVQPRVVITSPEWSGARRAAGAAGGSQIFRGDDGREQFNLLGWNGQGA
jgi:hypothetical protein